MSCDPVLYQLADYLHREAMAEKEQEDFEAWCEENELNPDDEENWKAFQEERFWDGFVEPDPDAGYDPEWAENYN